MSDFKATFMNSSLRINNTWVTLFWICPLCSGQCQCTQGDSDSYNNSVCLCFPGGLVDQLAWVFTIRWTLGRPHFLLSTLSVFWPVCFIHALRMKVWYLQEISIHFWQEQLSKALKYWTCKPSLGQMGSQDGNTSYSLILSSNGELKDPLKVKRGRIQKKGSSNCVNQSGSTIRSMQHRYL